MNNVEIMSYMSTSKNLNDLTFTDYFYRLMLISRSIFKWNNLPNGIDEKWIERWLFSEGQCVFFKDKNLGYMVAKVTPNGEINFYDEPTKVRPYGTNYIGNVLKNDEECVIIRNNDIMLPTAFTIKLFALRLADISRTIDINIHAQKTPNLIKCSEKQRISLKQLYKQWSGNEPVIFADNELNNETFDVLDTEAPIVFDKLQIQKHEILNECYTFLGINNANMNKRERLVDDEVQANNEQIMYSADVMLKARERACERINEIFGLNISVELRNKPDEFIEELDPISNEEAEEGVING
jgi:hypothetical protein